MTAACSFFSFFNCPLYGCLDALQMYVHREMAFPSGYGTLSGKVADATPFQPFDRPPPSPNSSSVSLSSLN